MTRPTETVSARFDCETLRTLDKAREPFGDSRGEYMRRAVMSHLYRDESQYIRAELAELRISSARNESRLVATLASLKKLTLLLLSVDSPISVDEAKQFVVDIFASQDEE